jgi:hypothetical protein
MPANKKPKFIHGSSDITLFAIASSSPFPAFDFAIDPIISANPEFLLDRPLK